MKKVLIVIIIILAIPLVIALFTKKEYTVEREIVINKPKQDVYNYAKFLKNHEYYDAWMLIDPNAKKEYKGTDGAPGASMAWDSENKNVGKGEQTINKLTEGERIDYGLHFIKPMEGDATAYMTFEAVTPTQTKIKWGFNGKSPYPLNFMLVIINMDKMLGDKLAEGLTNLKGVLEKQP